MNDKEYKRLLVIVKDKVATAQLKTVSAANRQLLLLYWQLGRLILENQQKEGWGARVIELLSADLKKEFSGIKGFSERNLKYMRKFAESYTIPLIRRYMHLTGQLQKPNISQQKVIALLLSDPNANSVEEPEGIPDQFIDNQENEFVQHPVAQMEEKVFMHSVLPNVTWSHHVVLMDKEPHSGKRLWYMLNSIEHGSSRNILAMQIESNLFERQVTSKKVSNFERTLPLPQSDFAQYLLKDPYIFDFVQARDKSNERDIEKQLADHIIKFLLELSQGFAFVGKQVHFEIGGADFYADLLFYHIRLRCYVVVELKARPFEPGDASQLNFYTNIVNDKLKTAQDNETIGLLLCKGKNEVVAEYSLKGYRNAIGISDYQLSKAVPEELRSSLPQIEDIESELQELN